MHLQKRVEVIIDRIIPPSLIILLIVIAVEFFFHDIAEHYHSLINWIDNTIIFIFIVDLIFKYLRIRNIPRFLKTCWLEIIAVIPAFLVVRSVEFFVNVTKVDRIAESLHGIVESEERLMKLVREAEQGGKVSRTALANRFLRPLARLPRFASAFVFFERPHHKHANH